MNTPTIADLVAQEAAQQQGPTAEALRRRLRRRSARDCGDGVDGVDSEG